MTNSAKYRDAACGTTLRRRRDRILNMLLHLRPSVCLLTSPIEASFCVEMEITAPLNSTSHATARKDVVGGR